MDEELDSILQFIDDSQRVCPQPQKWNELWNLLPNKTRKGAGWNPPAPLILAAWWETSDSEKKERLKEHILYAKNNDTLDKIILFLRSLEPNEWYYEDN